MLPGVEELLAAYRSGACTPVEVIERCIQSRRTSPDGVWISQVEESVLRDQARTLQVRSAEQLPLFGVPFAIKDNIDLAGLPTTAACPAYAYHPQASAFVVQRLVDAGAIPLGKTNLDQFATGLVGTRSPYGVCRNAFDADFISGGSSGGSAVAVALGMAAFSLGTDTAAAAAREAGVSAHVCHDTLRHGTHPTPDLLLRRYRWHRRSIHPHHCCYPRCRQTPPSSSSWRLAQRCCCRREDA